MADIAVAEHKHEQGAGEKANIAVQKPSEQPYPPSWVDRLDDRVQGLPIPAWLFYLGVALVLALARTIAAWSDGSYPLGTFPAHILLASTSAFLLFVLHY